MYNVHNAIDKNMHRHKRTVLSQGFSQNVLKKFEPAMLVHIKKFCSILRSGSEPSSGGWTSPKNMTDLCKLKDIDGKNIELISIQATIWLMI